MYLYVSRTECNLYDACKRAVLDMNDDELRDIYCCFGVGLNDVIESVMREVEINIKGERYA